MHGLAWWHSSFAFAKRPPTWTGWTLGCTRHLLPLWGHGTKRNFLPSNAVASKERYCTQCGVLDTVEHWFVCPLFSSLRHRFSVFPEDICTWPSCFRNHLLISRSCLVDELEHYFMQLSAQVDDFTAWPSAGTHHVFTDGAASKYKSSRLVHAAWAVVDSTSGMVVAGGPLAGKQQCIGRAELTALLSATAWGAYGPVDAMHIWCDSQHVVAGACFLLTHGRVPASWTHQDLWAQLLLVQEHYSDGTLYYHWVPSHLNEALCCTPFESWVARWNSVADKNAGFFDSDRGEGAHDLFARVRAHDRARLDKTFQFLVAVGEHRQQTAEVAEWVLSSEPEREHGDSLCSLLREQGVRTFEGHSLEPFLHEVQSWLLFHCTPDSQPQLYSFLELVFMMAFLEPMKFPCFAGAGGCRLDVVQAFFTRPTISQLLAPLRSAISELCNGFDVDIQPLDGRRMVGLGFFVPCFGLVLCLPSSLRDRCASALRSWTRSRPVRRSADLARPFLG